MLRLLLFIGVAVVAFINFMIVIMGVAIVVVYYGRCYYCCDRSVPLLLIISNVVVIGVNSVIVSAGVVIVFVY